MIGSSPPGRLPEPALSRIPIGRTVAAFAKEEMMKGLLFQRLVEAHPQDPEAPPVFGPGEDEKQGNWALLEKLTDFEPQVLAVAANDPALAIFFQAPTAQAVPPPGQNMDQVLESQGETQQFGHDLFAAGFPIGTPARQDEIGNVIIQEEKRGRPAEGVEDLDPALAGEAEDKGELGVGRLSFPGQ